MKRVLRWATTAWLLGAAIWALGAGAGWAQQSTGLVQSSPWIPPALQDTERLRAELDTAMAQHVSAQARLVNAEVQLKAGLVDDRAIQDAKSEVFKWRGVIEDLTTRVTRSRLYQALGRPVDVKFQDANIGDAAQVLAQAGGLAITVDAALQSAGRVTMTANRVPVVEVLRLLAQNTKAQVAPKPGAAGVLLRPVPTLEIDGQVREFPGPNAPWSPEWSEIGGPPQQMFGGGGLGGFQGGFGGSGFGGFGGGGVSGAAGGGVPGGAGFAGGRDPRGGSGGPMPGGPGAQGGFAPGGMPGMGYFPQPEGATLAITAVGASRFIVASHVGRRGGMDGGRPLILLSLYEIRDGKMQLVSSRLHDPGPVPGLPMPGAPGAGPGQGRGAPGAGPPGGPPPGRAPDPRPGVPPAPRQEARPDGGQDQSPVPALPVP